MNNKAFLVLRDGRIFEGRSIGAVVPVVGEVVFNTSMTGYQEILTDPSYCGQIVTFTYPMLGNYGINADDFESRQPFLRGVIIRGGEASPSNFRSEQALHSYLLAHQIPGISGIDTRALTRHIRQYGVIPGKIIQAESLEQVDLKAVQSDAAAFSDKEVIPEVSAEASYPYISKSSSHHTADKRPRIVAMDFGIKTNILHRLALEGFDIQVVPFDATAEEIEAFEPQGIFLSNGPGDPKSIPDSIKVIRQVVEKYPTMGICLGHQLLALAFDADTYKLKFGHRGANHPVQDGKDGKVYITTQNHGYAVESDSLKGTGFSPTLTNLNDGTNEGMRHEKLPIFSVQYHPEASAGPQDSYYLFGEFKNMVVGKSDSKQQMANGTMQ